MEEDPIVASRSGTNGSWWGFVQHVIPYVVVILLLFFSTVLVKLFAPDGSCPSEAFQPDGWDRVVIRLAGCVADRAGAFIQDIGYGVPPYPSVPQLPPPIFQPILVSGDTNSATKVYAKRPIYPAVARRARVCGAVVLDVVVGRTGAVRDVMVVSSVPLLDEAAVRAVEQWQYTPMQSEGKRIPFMDRVQVNFEMESLEGQLDGIRTWVYADAVKPPACPLTD